MWDAMAIMMGREELVEDEEWTNPVWRSEHKAEVDALVESWTMQMSKHEVMKLLGEAGIPCGAVLDAEDIHSDPHLLERGMITMMDHPIRGKFLLPGFPVQMESSPVEMEHAPLLGEHSAEVLRDVLGMSDEQIGELADQAVI